MFSFYRCFLLLTIATIILTCSFPESQTTKSAQKGSHNLEPIIQLGHSAEVTNALLVPNSGCVVSASLDGSLKIWDAFTDSLKTLQKVSSGISAVALSSDGKFVLSADADHGIKLWNTKTGKKIRNFQGHNGKVKSISFSGEPKR